MKEYHVEYEVISSSPGMKWKVDNTYHHTQSEAWERAEALAKKNRAAAVLHGKNGEVREIHNYRWKPEIKMSGHGKIDVPMAKHWTEE